MLANVSNSFAATLGGGGQAGTNDYTNQIFPAKVGLAKRPLNVVGPIGLPM